MQPRFLQLSAVDREVVSLDGVEVTTVAVTMHRQSFQQRVWGRNPSGEVFIFEKTRKGLENVTSRDKLLPQYAGIVPMVQMMEIA